jgi:hemerythrin
VGRCFGAEHRIFQGLIIDFHDARSQGSATDKMIRIFKEISKYAEFHFVSEENLMIDYHYPEQVQHVQMHRRLLADVGNKFHCFNSGQISSDAVFSFCLNGSLFISPLKTKNL